MKKKKIHRKLRLRKDTLRTLGQDTMGQVVGGTETANVRCATHTENHVCIATTLAHTCVHHPSVGCTDTQDCTRTCNLDCTNGCTLGCPTIGGTSCAGC